MQLQDLQTINALQNWTDSANISYLLVPLCIATSTLESGDLCFDGIDNDCNGFVDLQDTGCGLYPAVYSNWVCDRVMTSQCTHACNEQ